MKYPNLLVKLAVFTLVFVSVFSRHKRRLKRGSVDYEGACTPRWWPRNDCKDGLSCDIEEKICKVGKNQPCGKGHAERECIDSDNIKCLPPPEVFGKNGQEPQWICRELEKKN
jgi:hypothetical protein